LLFVVRAGGVVLGSAPRAFELPDDVKTDLDRILAEVQAHRPGT
jgi:hypothetical protein